jgi:hypothetical protein
LNRSDPQFQGVAVLYRIIILAQAESSRQAFRWSNVQEDNGIAIALVGLVIVFTALTLISLFIGFLPRILKALFPYLPQSTHVAPSPAESTAVDEEMVVAAIGLVLHTETQKAMRQ